MWYKGKKVLTGRSIEPGEPWILPIDGQQELNNETSSIAQNLQSIASVIIYTLPYKQQKVKYMHQTSFLVPAPTLLKAIANNQVTGFPCMNTKDIKRYLAPWPATPKVRMKKSRAGIRSMIKNGERD